MHSISGGRRSAWLLMLFCLYAQATCRPTNSGLDTRLHIKNNSARTIVPALSVFFPDTSLRVNFDARQNAADVDTQSRNIIYPQGDTSIRLGGTWEYTFAHEIPSGKLEIFIYDLNTLRTVPWDSIVQHYMILKRYDLTLDSLRQLNWIVEYP